MYRFTSDLLNLIFVSIMDKLMNLIDNSLVKIDNDLTHFSTQFNQVTNVTLLVANL